MLATRPVLLHAFIRLRDTRDPKAGQKIRENVPQAVVTLSEACIHAARHSHSLITEEWINGSLPMFGYFYAQYLFSSALILVISSLVPIGSPSDISSFETALEILRSMSEYGNLAAAEFHENLMRIKQCLEARSRKNAGDINAAELDLPENPFSDMGATASGAYIPVIAGNGMADIPLSGVSMLGSFTTEMAFQEPTMQDFLTQPDVDFGSLNPADMSINADNAYAYPPLSLWIE